MTAHRIQFHRDMNALEKKTLSGLDLVVAQLDRAIEAITYQDVELAGMVVADDDQIDRCYLDVHQGVLSLLLLQAPVADELRLIAALLQIIRCIERMGDQCVNVATLVPLSGNAPPKDKTILDLLSKMSVAVRQQVLEAHEAFRSRHVALARDLVRQDQVVNRLNRQIFTRAVEVGDEFEIREWSMFMTLVARCLERIGDNTVEIAEQTIFVITGLFRESSEKGREPHEQPD
jgi:phosphate transport system protein